MKRKLRFVLVLLLTVVLLALFLRSSDLRSVGHLIRQMRLEWFVVGLLANFAALVCRAERWRNILNPASRPPFYSTFLATALGFFSSVVLPIRAGDIVRPALLSRRTNIRFSSALGTVLTEKLLDLIAVLSLFAIFVFTSGRELALEPETAGKFALIRTVAFVGVGIIAALIAFMAALYFFHARLRAFFERVARLLPRRLRDSFLRMFDGFAGTLRVVHHPAAFFRVVGLTAVIWLCLTSQFYFVALAVRHPLPFATGFFVTGITILGLMIPTPAGIGGFHKACQIALTGFYGFTVDASVAVALIFHLVGIAPVMVTGLALFTREHFSWRQIIRMTEEAESAEETPEAAASDSADRSGR